MAASPHAAPARESADGITGAGFPRLSKQYAELSTSEAWEALDDGIISSEEAEKSKSSGERGLLKTQAEELRII